MLCTPDSMLSHFPAIGVTHIPPKTTVIKDAVFIVHNISNCLEHACMPLLAEALKKVSDMPWYLL